MILFDEIEKAHPDVFNTLLQVLDDGRLTDGKGRTVNFTNTIIIMTSNVGSSAILDATEDDDEALEETLNQILRTKFRPEFLNRIDDIIIFNKLEPEQMNDIVNIQLDGLKKHLAATKSIQIEFSSEVVKFLAEQGYDPSFGARPLKRLIQNKILNPLALEIIENKIKPNSQVNLTKDHNSAVIKFT